MELLSNRRILFVGDLSTQLIMLKNELQSKGAEVSECICSDVNAGLIKDNKINIIILNHLESQEICSNILNVLKGEDLATLVPVFSIVIDSTDEIQKVLSEGSADYITTNESTESILQKIHAVFSEESVFSSGTDIDISPVETKIISKGIKVFVIEDDPLLRNLLSIRMEKSSFPCEFSSDGKNVIPAMRHFMPDVIILDLMLPGRSGFDVLKEIKNEKDLKDKAVIVFSNKDGAGDRTTAKELGADGFYVKAMTDLSELVETIQTLSNKK
jgi:DNA-binding response OmpR family regulator